MTTMSNTSQREALAACRDVLDGEGWDSRMDARNRLMTMRIVLLHVVNALLDDERAILYFADLKKNREEWQPPSG